MVTRKEEVTLSSTSINLSTEDFRLSDEFLSQYKGFQPKWGFDGLGYIIYLRTYARKKEDGTLESIWETVRRFTEGNFQIEVKRLIEIGKWDKQAHDELMVKMERFYHLAFNLVGTPPGRGWWMSGTEYAERVGDAENNCWGVSMRPQDYMDGTGNKVSFAPAFTFDQAMKGGGVGVNIQRKYVSQIPKVNNKVSLKIDVTPTHADIETLKAMDNVHVYRTSTTEGYTYFNDNVIMYTVDDSRQGWANALRYVIDAHYEGKTEVILDLSFIRPHGALIKGFGGIASGPAPLVTMLNRVNDIINNRVGDFVTSTEWGDVIQNIGCCVVAGNVRRTALILIGDEDDKEYVESKNYELPGNVTASQWRWASNNSVDISRFTDRKTLHELAVNIFYNGEPKTNWALV